MAHRSDSSEQRAAEPLILAAAGRALGADLKPESLHLPGGSRVEVDGVDLELLVFVEVFAHQGRLKGAQSHKVARDALKLITVAREYPGARLAIAFGDHAASSTVTGSSWLAEALRIWGVEVLVVELDDDIRSGLMAAQTRQVMINPADDDPMQ